jgi:hypothetical protein
MATQPKGSQHLQPLNTHWHNRSLSSISATSDAATFHSAHAHPSHMEMQPLSQPTPISQPVSPLMPMSSPKLEALKMDRQDSGYSDTPRSPGSSSRRTSTSSTDRRSTSKSKRRTTNSSTASASRPLAKRSPKSTTSVSAQIRTSSSGRRPSITTRHTTPYSQTVHQPYQFFHFPTLTDPQSEPNTVATPPPPPPATVQYWTSDSTRRLEYAAIDAASKGVKGFFIKLVPDCILPANSRRLRFHCEDADSDAGSVRRYRLALPEEKDGRSVTEGECSSGESSRAVKRPAGGILRRWSLFGRQRA